MDSSSNYNNLVQSLLTDKYQISMCYAYWHDGKHEDTAVFDLFFRKSPFRGEYTIFAGLGEALRYIKNLKFRDEDVDYLRSIPDYMHLDEAFWKYLLGLNTSTVKLSALNEGTVCFPNTPLISVEGPLGLLQLVETTLLNLINYASLMATNAARYKFAARAGNSSKCKLLEFGLRRAQGPDGGLSASRYSYIGGFDGTSNLLAGKKFGIPVCGTLGHSFMMSYHGQDLLSRDLSNEPKTLMNRRTNSEENLTLQCIEVSKELIEKDIQWCEYRTSTLTDNDKDELKSFISFAWSFPDNFLALIDTYDVIKSGLVNFCIVAIALVKFGYQPKGVRIDSGDLAYLSLCAKQIFQSVAEAFGVKEFSQLEIIASNDINEDTIISLNDQNHAITGMGIGTHLVTCQAQPALGCVYKLVEVNGNPCMKLSSTPEKVNIPCKKCVYRLFGRNGFAILDLISIADEPAPVVGERILCRHPFIAEKRCYVTPTRVESLLLTWWDSEQVRDIPKLGEARMCCSKTLDYITEDIKRFLNPTPYKVAVSEKLFTLLNSLRINLTPIGELS